MCVWRCKISEPTVHSGRAGAFDEISFVESHFLCHCFDRNYMIFAYRINFLIFLLCPLKIITFSSRLNIFYQNYFKTAASDTEHLCVKSIIFIRFSSRFPSFSQRFFIFNIGIFLHSSLRWSNDFRIVRFVVSRFEDTSSQSFLQTANMLPLHIQSYHGHCSYAGFMVRKRMNFREKITIPIFPTYWKVYCLWKSCQKIEKLQKISERRRKSYSDCSS